MVKLELELTDIDYDTLIRDYLPKVQEKLKESGSMLSAMLSGDMAATLLRMAPDSVKDKLAAEILNLGASRLERQMEEIAARNGLPGRVRNFKATAVEEAKE